MGQDATEIRGEIEATRARMDETVAAIGYKADVPSRVRDNVNDRIESVKGTIGDTMGAAKDAVLERTQSTQRVTSMALENPLGLALGAFGVGLLAGLMIPISDVERSTLRPIRDNVATRAQNAVAQAVDAGKTILTDAAG